MTRFLSQNGGEYSPAQPERGRSVASPGMAPKAPEGSLGSVAEAGVEK